jgi:hypothetical protein
MSLLKLPRRPAREELASRTPRSLYKGVHETWVDYLYWDSPLEDD